MNDPKSDWDAAWQGLEPQQPRPRRSGLVIALAAVGFLALGACALGYYVLQARAPAEPALVLPGETTVAGATGETLVGATAVATEGLAVAPTVTLPGSFATPPQPPPAADVVAPRLAAPPTIDGDAADWIGPPTYSSPYVVFTGDEWDGSDDLAAAWQVGWDDANLYLIVHVADEVHVQTQTGNTTFRGDSIELQIDADRAGDYGPAVSPDDFQINLSPGDFAGIAPSAFRFQGTRGGEMRDATTPHGIMVAATPDGTGYVIEAAIPWSDLNLAPSPGLVIGLAVNVNENDSPGTAAQEMMKSNAPNRRFGDPTTWGTLTIQ
jgi:hypothetical protein